MSGKAMEWAADHGPSDPTDLLVLLMLAHHVREAHGCEYWGPAALLADKCGLNDGTVRRALARLVAGGWLERVAEADAVARSRAGQAVRYRLNLPASTARPPRAVVTPSPSRRREDPTPTEQGGPVVERGDPAPRARQRKGKQVKHTPKPTQPLPGLADPVDGGTPPQGDPINELARREWDRRDVKPCGGNFLAFRQQIARQVNAGASLPDLAALLPMMHVFTDASFDLARSKARQTDRGPRSRAEGWSRTATAGKVDLT